MLWRVADAFARTDRQQRAIDAYRYVLANCDNPAERLASMQKALDVLPRPALDALIKEEREAPDGAGEFAPVRDEMARRAVAAGDKDAELTVAPADVATVERLADAENKASDALLLGWYHLLRNNIPEAEKWFRRRAASRNRPAPRRASG